MGGFYCSVHLAGGVASGGAIRLDSAVGGIDNGVFCGISRCDGLVPAVVMVALILVHLLVAEDLSVE